MGRKFPESVDIEFLERHGVITQDSDGIFRYSPTPSRFSGEQRLNRFEEESPETLINEGQRPMRDYTLSPQDIGHLGLAVRHYSE